jgi:L-ribulose-5-phosphate 4-epimerase
MGTTHADYFRGDVPVTRPMREDEVANAYERHTGLVIVETFTARGINPGEIPAVLVAHHGPFTWGTDPLDAIEHAHVLEWLAQMDVAARAIAPDAPPPSGFLVDKHYFRKHGANAYYGQKR